MEESRIVTADGSLQSLVHHVADRVVTHIQGVTKHHVAQRAGFDTDVPLDDLLKQVGEKSKLEPMADTLRVEKDGIVHVGNGTVMSLTSVEETRHVVSHTFCLLCAED